MALDKIQRNILMEIAGLHQVPEGAYNIRLNGKTDSRASTANIDIVSKTDVSGIDIIVKPGTKNQSVHIPVILSESGLSEVVYNDFYIGEDSDVVIVAGCGISNCGGHETRHDGVHTFHIGRNSHVKYVEKHYGEGDGLGENVMNPRTVCYLEEGAFMEMDTVQIKGVDSTMRRTEAHLKDNAAITISEKIMTHGSQHATTEFSVDLDGAHSSANVVSRSVARDHSTQTFISYINGNNECSGHTECDAIIMDEATVSATPALNANSTEASLIHEAAIGKIAGEQLIKLMTLGLTEKEAEEEIVSGFLK
ncbi:MAG: SufD family Fe-S cluster assembly protein [Eubacteriaceae bacterium]|nr:SufD family Fe-S cluster assembly protein [Eubacteriaceae bacterium]MBR5995324.1 SufD family Fe-S cluster assembly protein [Eubacteriaceae bacterium]